MSEASFHHALLLGFVAVALVTFPVLLFISAPYGRHVREGWGPTIDATLGWVLMEAPSPLIFATCFFVGGAPRAPAAIAFLLLWEAHYIHRAFIFPFRRRGGQRRMPASVAAMAFLFNVVNGYLNGRWLFTPALFDPPWLSSPSWLTDPRFLIGAALFVIGYAINQHADHVLFTLRKPGETGYRIPYGGLYRWVSCPSYTGEILEWFGWALLTWSPAGLAFAVWTTANLLPRAITHHRWYKEKFPDYPPSRRAIIPFVL